MKNKIVRQSQAGGFQGDVLLLRIDALPNGAKLRKGKEARILARGEVTGHNHILEGDVEVYDLAGQFFAKVLEGGAKLVHGGKDAKTDFDHFQQKYQPGLYVYIPQVTEENEPMLD